MVSINDRRSQATNHTDSVGYSAQGRPTATLGVRLYALLFARRLDREISIGIRAPLGTAHAYRRACLVSLRERSELAESLAESLHEAVHGRARITSRVPMHSPSILAASDLIDRVISQLLGPGVVRACGVARLRLLLGDGCGPFYRKSDCSLIAELRGVLAAL
jgi:hypothetical protein